MSSEFELIRRHFTRPTRHTVLGAGDDAALLAITPGMELAVSADMLVAGTHFFGDADPWQLGWKSLAVNLSDLAAMGALPKWATLAIALPQADEPWIAQFAEGFFSCAERYQVDLVGGDTTRGPLAISVQIMGEVQPGKALRRAGAQPDDEVWVSGMLGSAALALAALQGRYTLPADELASCLPALHMPQPRVELGLLLAPYASSAIDISDGLLADLGHILEASRLGAELDLRRVPCGPVVRQRLIEPDIQRMALAGGDDYELCFTAPARFHGDIMRLAQLVALPLSCIGTLREGSGIAVCGLDGTSLQLDRSGFDHFA
jgi:thiamine-monophosphate kinase